MAHSLLAHLYSRIRGSQEDVATLSLQYLLAQSPELNRAFTNLLAMTMEVTLDTPLQYVCQAAGEDQERPDMAGVNTDGRETVLCEMKFYAGLTLNQPRAYLERLRKSGGCGLVFVCPKARQTSLWAKLQELCAGCDVVGINSRCVRVDGVHMALVTWAEVIEALRHVAAASAVAYLSDIQQLEGYCAQMDSDAFIPFRAEDLTAESAKKAERYYAVLDEVIRLLCADPNLETSLKGLKATAHRRGYGRGIYVDEFTLSINYDRGMWKNNASVETPFWVAFRAADWEQKSWIVERMRTVPAHKKDSSLWSMTWLALEPLQDATFDEVCADLKRQILDYMGMFRTNA